MSRPAARVNVTIDTETGRALESACHDDGSRAASKARAYIREGLRRDGYLLTERAKRSTS